VSSGKTGETEEGKMMWANNPEILRELHQERVRQMRRTMRRPRLKLIAMEREADATGDN
jgi:hypothetical protein